MIQFYQFVENLLIIQTHSIKIRDTEWKFSIMKINAERLMPTC